MAVGIVRFSTTASDLPAAKRLLGERWKNPALCGLAISQVAPGEVRDHIPAAGL